MVCLITRSQCLPSRHRRSEDVDGFTAHRFTFPVIGVCTLMGMLASGSMLPKVSITGFYLLRHRTERTQSSFDPMPVSSLCRTIVFNWVKSV